MKLLSLFVFIILLSVSCGERQEKLVVAIAANLSAPVNAIADAYQAKTGVSVDLVVASSGVLTAQIRNGAPFHIFLSADEIYPQLLAESGSYELPPRVFTHGNLVLWIKGDSTQASVAPEAYLDRIITLAIANPELAPYGMAAREWLIGVGKWEAMSDRIVFGENVGQVNQYIRSGAVDGALTAISAVHAEELSNLGTWVPLAIAGKGIPHAGLILDIHHPEALAFWDFLFSDESQRIFAEFGYG